MFDISPASATAVQAIGGCASILIAVIAIIITIRAEGRATARFHQEQEIAQKIAQANIKPLLDVDTLNYEDFKGVKLMNHGTGTAIITDISFSKNNETSRNLATLIHLGESILWDTYFNFDQRTHFLQSGKEIMLVKLSAQNLTGQLLRKPEALKLLEAYKDQLAGVKVHIVYEDVLGNKQPDYERLFS